MVSKLDMAIKEFSVEVLSNLQPMHVGAPMFKTWPIISKISICTVNISLIFKKFVLIEILHHNRVKNMTLKVILLNKLNDLKYIAMSATSRPFPIMPGTPRVQADELNVLKNGKYMYIIYIAETT